MRTGFAPSNRRQLLAGLAAAWLAPGAALASNRAVDAEVDTSNAPELAQWGVELKARIAGWWPLITSALASPGYEAPDVVHVRFATLSPANIGAFTRGDTIIVNRPDIAAHPDDYGRVAHELVHVVQAYPEPNIGWLVEGIADYMRYYVLLPHDPRRAFDAAHALYDRGYQPAAALLDWVERAHPGAVKRINAAMRQGGDGELELYRVAGSTPLTLWRAYLKSRPA